MEMTFDTAMLALKEIAKLSPNPEDAVKGITMAAIAYRLIADEGLPEEMAKEIIFRVESVQKHSRAALSLEERVDNFLNLVTTEGTEVDVATSLERVLALDDQAPPANIDEMACTIMSQVVEDFDGGC